MTRGLILGSAAALLGGLLIAVAAHQISEPTTRESALALVLIGAVAFVVASRAAEDLINAHSSAAEAVHGFANSMLVLAATVVLGLPVASHLAESALVVRIVIGMLIGAVGGLLVAAVTAAIAWGIWVVARLLLKAVRWRSSRTGRRAGPVEARLAGVRRPRGDRVVALAKRLIALAVAGQLLAIVAQAIVYRWTEAGALSDVEVPVAAWLIGSLVGWWLTLRLRQDHTHHVSRHVVHAVGVSVFALAVLTAVFASLSSGSAASQLWKSAASSQAGGAPIDWASLGIDPTAPTRSRDDQLAQAFRPDLWFAPGESWHPTTVDWYLAHARLVEGAGSPTGPPVTLPTTCASSCHIELPCDSLRGECTNAAPAKPAVYALVRHTIGSRAPPAFQGTTTVIQYWFFYNYDSLETPALSQWHQADWEQVTVGLEGATPTFVGYSEHCFGVWMPWKDVLVTQTTHPRVYVAAGSHANYPRQVDAPLRGASCLGVKQIRYMGVSAVGLNLAAPGGVLEVPADYVLGSTDHTGAVPGGMYPAIVIQPSDPVASFPGTWGLDNRVQPRFRPSKGLPGAPDSPTRQSVWEDPGKNILCGHKWFHPGRIACIAVTG